MLSGGGRVFGLIACGLTLATAACGQGKKRAPAESRPVTAQKERAVPFSALGAVSGLRGEAAGAEVISSEEEWKKALAGGAVRIAGAAAEVDFGRHTVVVVSAGMKPTGGHSVVVERVVEVSGRRLRVEYKVPGPEPGMMVTQALTYPSAVIRVEGKFESVELKPSAGARR